HRYRGSERARGFPPRRRRDGLRARPPCRGGRGVADRVPLGRPPGRGRPPGVPPDLPRRPQGGPRDPRPLGRVRRPGPPTRSALTETPVRKAPARSRTTSPRRRRPPTPWVEGRLRSGGQSPPPVFPRRPAPPPVAPPARAHARQQQPVMSRALRS